MVKNTSHNKGQNGSESTDHALRRPMLLIIYLAIIFPLACVVLGAVFLVFVFGRYSTLLHPSGVLGAILFVVACAVAGAFLQHRILNTRRRCWSICCASVCFLICLVGFGSAILASNAIRQFRQEESIHRTFYPIVQAIYKYKQIYDRLPQSLDDLDVDVQGRAAGFGSVPLLHYASAQDGEHWMFLVDLSEERDHRIYLHRSDGSYPSGSRRYHNMWSIITPVIEDVKILDYGIYGFNNAMSSQAMPSSAASIVQPVASVALLKTTTEIPPVMGMSFGCRFILQGEPNSLPVHLTIKVKHPPFEKPTGKTTETVDTVRWPFVIGRTVGYTYTFDHPWEAVPGVWSIDVLYCGKRLASQTFTVQNEQHR